MAAIKSQPKVMANQKGGRFILSDDKIRELAAGGLTSGNYISDARYYRNIPENIIINSNIEKISKMDTDNSLYGLIYKLTLKEGVESPLVKVHVNEDTPDHGDLGKTSCSMNTFFRKQCLKSVRTFLIKVSFISKDKEVEIEQQKLSVKKGDFLLEADSQNYAYEKTFEYGESVVPACISPPIIDPIEQHRAIHPILTKLLEPEIDKDGWLKTLMKGAKKQDVKDFGIIFMEFAEGYRTLRDILEDPSVKSLHHIKATVLAKMAHLALYEKGIAQGDAHNQNIMINLNYVGFLGGGRKGKALVIDFGRATNITEAEKARFGLSKNIKQEDYNNIFHYLKYISNFRGKMTHPPYDWLAENNFMGEDDLIRTCFNQRKWRSQQIKAKFQAVLPNVIKRDYLFSQFLMKSDFNNFIHLRWKDVLNEYNYNPKPEAVSPSFNKTNSLSLSLTPSPPSALPPIKYREFYKFSPEAGASDLKPIVPPIKVRELPPLGPRRPLEHLPMTVKPRIIKVGNELPPIRLIGKKKKDGGKRKTRKNKIPV